MKNIKALLLTFILAALFATTVHAQASESLWLEADRTAYKTGETVIVRVNASSSAPVQGFTFQIRYDATCLEPLKASSPLPGMNGLQLPQTAGLVDASFASTAPQNVAGVLAEVSFKALKGCQTDLYLESAALAMRDSAGFAVPVPNATIGERSVVLNIDSAVGQAQEPATIGESLSLTPEKTDAGTDWAAIIAVVMLFVVIGVALGAVIFVVYKRSKN